jgi:hypothetical protein
MILAWCASALAGSGQSVTVVRGSDHWVLLVSDADGVRQVPVPIPVTEDDRAALVALIESLSTELVLPPPDVPVPVSVARRPRPVPVPVPVPVPEVVAVVAIPVVEVPAPIVAPPPPPPAPAPVAPPPEIAVALEPTPLAPRVWLGGGMVGHPDAALGAEIGLGAEVDVGPLVGVELQVDPLRASAIAPKTAIGEVDVGASACAEWRSLSPCATAGGFRRAFVQDGVTAGVSLLPRAGIGLYLVPSAVRVGASIGVRVDRDLGSTRIHLVPGPESRLSPWSARAVARIVIRPASARNSPSVEPAPADPTRPERR